MENDFEHIESEYESFKSSFEGYIFDILYNISNFFDEYETFVMEASCVCSDYVFSTEKSKTKYQGITSKCEDMKDESISMFGELKSIQESGGGFSDSEERTINSFKINSLI